MNRLFSVGLVAFLSLGFQSQSLAGEGEHECGCTTLRIFVPVSGAKQPWQLCVRNNDSTQCSWLEAGDTKALFVSSIPSSNGLGDLGNDGASKEKPFITVFVQNHPEGQACVVENPESSNTSVRCYDIVQ